MATWADYNQKKLTKKGKKAIQKAGSDNEEAVKAALEYYEAVGWALIEKNNPAILVERNLGGGRIEGRFTQSALPDMIGAISAELIQPGGIGIMFDIKSQKQSPGTEVTKLHRAHQYHALARWGKFGYITGYLIRWYFDGNTVHEPMNEWRWHWPDDCSTDFFVRKVNGHRKPVEMVLVRRADGLVVPTFQQPITWDTVTTPDFLHTVARAWLGRRHHELP